MHIADPRLGQQLPQTERPELLLAGQRRGKGQGERPCGSGRLEAAQSPGPALPGLCLTPDGAGVPGSLRHIMPAKGDGLAVQPLSRKQSPEGARSRDITAANLSCFLKAFP